MKNMLEQLFLPFTAQLGMFPSQNMLYKNCGDTFQCDTEIGNGFFWGYSRNDQFSITVYDFKTEETISPYFEHPEFFTIGLFSAPTAKYVLGEKRTTQQIISYAQPEGSFSETFPSGTHVNSAGLTFSPDFLKDLTNHYDIEYSQFIKDCFYSSKECTSSDTQLILKQIFSAEPSAACASMYYEGKILELLSSFIQWQTNNQKYVPEGLTQEDSTVLEYITRYLYTHFGTPICIDTLVKMAFMSKNKLCHIFRLKYGMSILEYLRGIRINHAKDYLINTSLSIKVISSMVGYQNPASFAERFKEETGLTPTEYRNLIHQTIIN